jgi:hypothetical protein
MTTTPAEENQLVPVEVNPTPKVGVRGPESNALISALEVLQEGQAITYDQLSEVVNFDVQQKRGPLDTARTYLMREKGMHFQVVHGEGLVRMSHTEAAIFTHETFNQKLRTVVRKTGAQVDAIEYGQLETEHARQSFSLTQAQLAITESAVDRTNYNRLKEQVATNNFVPLQQSRDELLKMLSGK